MFKIAVLVSGGGSNLGSIIEHIKSGYIKNTSIEYVISDTPDVYALTRAKENNIKNELQEKMNSFEQEKRLKQERLNNLKTVKETTENSINNMKEKLGQ